jgi:hypothetical protein
VQLLHQEAIPGFHGYAQVIKRQGLRDEGDEFPLDFRIGLKENGVIADGPPYRVGQDGVKLPGFGQEKPVPPDGIGGTVQEEGAAALNEKVKFIIPGIVGMVTAVPGKFIPPDEFIDIHSVLDPHDVKISILDMFCQYQIWINPAFWPYYE